MNKISELDLIDRAALIEALNKCAMEHHENQVPMVEHDFRKLVNEAEMVKPSEKVIAEIKLDMRRINEVVAFALSQNDVVRVIRCKDCKYWGQDGACRVVSAGIVRATNRMDFCSNGELG